MKHCPQCSTGYPDSHTTCPTHGVLLNEIRDLKPGMVIRQSYRIIRKLGQGGMGAVYLAQHILMDEPRALKFLSPELSRDQAFTGRFLREVRVLRQIRNRNVVDCGDLEAAEDGSLFFSMEYVDGPDLRDLLNNTPGPFPVAQALSIARGIAEGLGAAHAKGMVHRDIKPENILMARDSAWLPKIADFGIVATKESSTAYTRTGGTLLTMAYAAPEQWRGMPAAELDGRIDLYALGGVLYEMLTGQTPFHAENYEGWAEQHRNATPQPPSALRPELANWQGLDALILRLLAKDREQRPRNVAELLGLLDAVRYGAPVVRQATIPDEAVLDVIEKPAYKATAPDIRSILKAALQGAVGIKGKSVSRKELPVIWQILIVIPVLAIVCLLMWYSLTSHRPEQPANSTTQKTPVTQQQQARPQPVSEVRTLLGHSDIVNSVAFSPNGRTLASGSEDNTIKLWDVASGQVLHTLKGHTDWITSLAFSPNGRTLASGSLDGTIKLWDVSSGQLQRTLHNYSSKYLAFSPDGRTLASGSGSSIMLWDAASGQVLRNIIGYSGNITSLAFSSDGRTLASGYNDANIRLFDVASSNLLRTLQSHSGIVESVALSPDGRTLASGNGDKTVELWDVDSGQLLRTLMGHTHWVNSVAFSPNGRTLASGSADNTIKLWDVASGHLLRTLHGHSGIVRSVAYSPDGRTLASGSDDKTIKLWDLTGAQI